MTAARSDAAMPAPRALHGPQASGWWGMVCLIATEATLFIMLLFGYFYIRWNSSGWPQGGIKQPDFTLAIPGTILLLTSSIPMQWAEWGIRRDRQEILKLGLWLAFVEAAVFVALELYEWTHLGYGPTVNAYTSLFFTITGIHLLHVTAALGMNLYLQLRTHLGHFNRRRFLAVENITLYWHFVDVVWILVFSSLYVSPHFR